MKIFLRIALFSALPALSVALALWLLATKGPFWLGSNSDPEYAYLLNSLSLAIAKMPALSEHPGTTVLEFGALVLRAAHAVFGRGDIVDDVLTRPEFYLHSMSFALLAFFAAVQIAAGVLARRCGYGLTLCLLLQCAPLVSMTSIDSLACVKPEAFLQPIVALLALSVVLALKANSIRPGAAALLGALMALALVSKVTALPLLLVPLSVLCGWRARGIFLAACVLTGVVLLLPIYKLWPFMLRALWGIVSHTGPLGTGAPGFADPAAYLANLWSLLSAEWLTALLVFCGLSVWIFQLCGARSKEGSRDALALLGVNLAMAVQFLIVSKHPSRHYLQPALSLSGLNLFLIFRVASRMSWSHSAEIFAATTAALLIAFQIFRTSARAEDWRSMCQAQMQIVELQPKQGDAKIIYYYRSSSVVSALAFGDGYSGGRFGGALQKLYPHALFYSLWHKHYHNFNEDVFAPEKIDQWAASEPVFLQGSPFEGDNTQYRPAHADLELNSPPGPEVLYRLKSAK